MSRCNFLQRSGSDYRINDISPGTFADFRLKIFTQEKNIAHMVTHVRKIFNCLQIPYNCCEKNLNMA